MKTKHIMTPVLDKEKIMARKKPYTLTLAIFDVVLTVFTGGFWLLIVLVRELRARS